MNRLAPARIAREEAGAFVRLFHRHHKPDQGDRFVIGVWNLEREELCGVAVVGRPRAPGIPQDSVVEVTRCCTDGTKNACSYLYAQAAAQAQVQGFRAIITYTRSDESRASLRALGWWPEDLERVNRHEWTNRAEREAAAHGDVRWLKLLNDFRAPPAVSSGTTTPAQLSLLVAG